MAEILAIDIVGADYHGNVEKNIIYRLNRKPSIITDYPYLVVCEKIDQMFSLSPSIADIFVVKDIKKINANLKKNKVKKGIGLEVTIADLRKADGLQVGKWFNQIRGLYKFCKSSNCQLILSSGANSALEMVSGRSFDSILKICDINPESYWRELEMWIESKRRIRCL